MLKILLVDDSKTTRLVIRGFLEDVLGEEVLIDEATDGTEAVDYIKKDNFQI
ncbi:hypothetical protein HYV88_03180 [Candidatus Woesearchaeota archaeon]|nr:hypothetical protein [Candidatus Woesearchaeota archaeon]